MSQIVIVSGPPGAGKSSVCEALCERYDRTVHLETDWLFEAVRMGYLKPWMEGAERQNQMVARACARAATAYAEDLYAVFIDGVIGPNVLPTYVEELKPAGVPVHFALLMPSLEAAMQRLGQRNEAVRLRDPQLGAKLDGGRERELAQVTPRLHRWLADAGDFGGCRIDNSAMTAEQAADAVMELCGRGACVVG